MVAIGYLSRSGTRMHHIVASWPRLKKLYLKTKCMCVAYKLKIYSM